MCWTYGLTALLQNHLHGQGQEKSPLAFYLPSAHFLSLLSKSEEYVSDSEA